MAARAGGGWRWRTATVLLVVGALVAAACASEAGSGADGPGRSGEVEVNGLRLTEAELHYGLAPEPHPEVTYAPDVVLVGGGANSVRSVTADGMTWTLDAAAPRADELAVGKVMFVTGRGVGRVLAIEASDDDLSVTIGPVDITDVIHDGEFAMDGQPLELDDMIVYDSGELPWSVAEVPPDDGGGEGGAPAEGGGGGGEGGPVGIQRLRAPPQAEPEPPPEAVRVPSKPPTRGEPGITTAGAYSLRPLCCGDGGPGVRVRYDGGGAYLLATVRVFLEQPRASWNLSISGGKVRRADFTIHGGGGFGYQFDARTSMGPDGNLNDRIAVPTTFSIPFVVLGVPFSLTISQSLIVNTAFTAQESAMGATGRWNLSGGIGFGYRDGGFRETTPTGFSTRSSMLDQIKGISLDTAAIVLGHSLRVKVGIGWDAFQVGPFAELVTTVGATRGSAAASPLTYCRGVWVNGWVGFGIGYSLPKVVVEVVNFFLRIVGASTIREKGELVGERYKFLDQSAQDPDLAICKH